MWAIHPSKWSEENPSKWKSTHDSSIHLIKWKNRKRERNERRDHTWSTHPPTCDVWHDWSAASEDECRVPAEEVFPKALLTAVPQGASVCQVIHPRLSHAAQLKHRTHKLASWLESKHGRRRDAWKNKMALLSIKKKKNGHKGYWVSCFLWMFSICDSNAPTHLVREYERGSGVSGTVQVVGT